jgi:hypothetical protein
MLNVIVLVSATILATSDRADESSPRCEGNAEVVGSCFVVHGRLRAGNGNPTQRIWRIGTKRILGIREEFAIPKKIEGLVTWATGATLYGDFEVCPLTHERAGHMQIVCVEDARNLVLEDASGGVRKLRWSWSVGERDGN